MLGGPAEKTYVPAAEAKAYAANENVLQFLAGTWVDEDTEKPTKQTFTFNPDGTFVFMIDGRKLEGKATVAGPSINLDYQTVDGKPLQAFLDEVRKGEESGRQGAVLDGILVDYLTKDLEKMRQLSLGEDPKTIAFGPPPAPEPAPGMGGEDSIDLSQLMARKTLVRAEEKK